MASLSGPVKAGILVGVIVAAMAIAVVVALTRSRPDIVIGGKDFTEQSILCEMMAVLIEENTDLKVGRKLFLGGTMVCFNALTGGDLDLYAEYTGTGLVNILKQPAVNDPNEVYRTVRDRFEQQYGLMWMQPFGFNNTYTLTMRRAQAEELGIKTFSDLAAHLRRPEGKAVRGGFTAEFIRRPDGYKGLVQAYDLRFAGEPKQFDPGLMYKACADAEVDVICGFATDGRIAAYNLFVLEDDKKFFPAYYAAPLVRKATLAKFPRLQELLNRLAGRLSNQTMQKLNLQVDKGHRRPRDVAREFLVSAGLIPA
ncbi:MAG TPA: glycine betaine ABC transporter substrate-binding protein [Phycisphaerae bacterium]|nr:glycine betaine ABC transporter substrate-binding protein [Phycisphaerae bacterium]